MRIQAVLSCSFAAMVLSSAAIGQTAPSDIDSHVAAAKAAAALDFRGTFMALCLPASAPGGAAGGRGPAPAGPATARPTPDRSTWYAAPYKLFDNFYWLGTRQHSSWLLKTSAGLILIDTNYAFAIQPEILDGIKKLGFDPHQIKYMILSHAHGDHDQGVATIQKFGAHVVMGAPDWADTLKRTGTDYAGGVPTKGPDDIAIGPEGKTITLGDTTVNIVFTPGHTVGTISEVFPVKDHGKTVMVAYSGGTLTGAFGSNAARWDEYIDSQKRIAAAAKAADASVLISNHSEYDDAYTKARLVTAKREEGEENPFIVGADGVQRYFTVMEECAAAAKLRNNAK